MSPMKEDRISDQEDREAAWEVMTQLIVDVGVKQAKQGLGGSVCS